MVSAKKNKFSHSWLHDHINDPYVKLAQREGYRARAAYKLKEMDEAEGLIKPGMRVVDLGSTPGAWSQYVRRKLAVGGTAEGQLRGTIVALDMNPMAPIADVTFLQGDFREDAVLALIDEAVGSEPVDVVLSDMAPNLSGIALADAARMSDLHELALEFALAHLKPQGALLVKCFHGSGYTQTVERFKKVFKVVKPLKPKASRDKSSETFLLGRGLKAAVKTPSE
jgi:23S rRNA (uridine2552-2'-O)-methyltransferase